MYHVIPLCGKPVTLSSLQRKQVQITGFALCVLLTPVWLDAQVSDDFFPEESLDSVWRFFDPAEDCTLTATGTSVLLDIPTGSSHDLWCCGQNRAPRVLQPILDDDLRVEVKFESLPTTMYQLQGIVVQETNNTFLRMGTVFYITELRVFAAFIDGSARTVFYSKAPQDGILPLRLRADRPSDYVRQRQRWILQQMRQLGGPAYLAGVLGP